MKIFPWSGCRFERKKTKRSKKKVLALVTQARVELLETILAHESMKRRGQREQVVSCASAKPSGQELRNPIKNSKAFP